MKFDEIKARHEKLNKSVVFLVGAGKQMTREAHNDRAWLIAEVERLRLVVSDKNDEWRLLQTTILALREQLKLVGELSCTICDGDGTIWDDDGTIWDGLAEDDRTCFECKGTGKRVPEIEGVGDES